MLILLQIGLFSHVEKTQVSLNENHLFLMQDHLAHYSTVRIELDLIGILPTA
jgi:hypothetical protein